MHLRTASTAVTSLLAPSKTTPEDVEIFYVGAEDVLLPYLDSLYGSSIDASDHTVFTKLTQKYEARFNEDMRSLNVLEPDVVTRVTEYGDQIVQYVDKIIQHGFAYATDDGSVYFDIESFEKREGNHYARLEPWNRNDTGLQADGEGALSTLKTSAKRNDSDFALWKSSKPGEPAWDSPWGKGRP
jgi:cysteinyl-tRNA synthetase